jgi:uncharacterized protein
VIKTRVAVTGSSGMIGTALAASLVADGHQVVRLVRRRPANEAGSATAVTESSWDPDSADGSLDRSALDGIDAVVHLASAGIADQRWTAERKAKIRRSRVQGTRALACGLAGLGRPPAVLLSGSAIGWYGDTGTREVDESAPVGSGFLAGLVSDWEAAARPASAAGIRVACLRTGIVLSPSGGTLAKMLPPFRRGLGVKLGTGAQYMSWISLADHIGAVRFLLGRADISGPVNLTAPNPVTNAEFTQALARALHRPAVLRAPVPALRLALGAVADEILVSARVLPRRLLDSEYEFRHTELAAALESILHTPPQNPAWTRSAARP